ncbi:pimeloyl-ACP methyl esterase BioG family protein, partial [Campylobacter jejuni]
MKISNLIQNENSQELILVFGGLASHPSHFAHLKSDKNVVLVYDYENLDFKFDLKSFSKITLIAFSMGVCVASRVLKDIEFSQKIAINGTPFGIDKLKGIHPAIFAKQIKKFDLTAFKKSLFKERKNEAKNFIFKDEKDLKTELEKLFEFASKECNENFIWDKIYSSNNDEIFPQNALKNTFSKLIFLNEPHFAF